MGSVFSTIGETADVLVNELSNYLVKLTLEEKKNESLEVTSDKRLRFKSCYQYQQIFSSLIKMESEYNRKKNIEIKWVINKHDNKVMAYFPFPVADEDSDEEIIRGDKLKLILRGKDVRHWSGIGYVFQVPVKGYEVVGLIMEKGKNIPVEHSTGFCVQFLWESVAYDRMERALDRFADFNSHLLPYIRDKILGDEEGGVVINSGLPEYLVAPNLPELNESQMNAIRRSLNTPISLIQGPPGTGKTVTSATIVYHLVRSGKTPVLVCAQSNIAVDQLTQKIEKTGLRVVRLYSKRREGPNNLIDTVAVHQMALKMNPELRKLQQQKDDGIALTDNQKRKYENLKKLYESSVLNSMDIICCTCIGAGDSRLARIKFSSLLIDESTQATEPECLVPIMKTMKPFRLHSGHLILVGDHKQLGPVVKCKKAADSGLELSMFERLVKIGIPLSRLEIQYRMHPILSEFSSKQFYDSALQNGITSGDRQMKQLSSLWPNPKHPTFFYCSEGKEERDKSGTSFINKKEAMIVENIVFRLKKLKIEAKDIGVITPYKGQLSYLVRTLEYNRTYDPELEVASVNAFQGREKDLIIFSCVRSNNKQTIGFLKDPRRLNVALTRAKYGFIIVGNPEALSNDPLWKDLLNFYANNNLMFEGPLNRLRKRSFNCC